MDVINNTYIQFSLYIDYHDNHFTFSQQLSHKHSSLNSVISISLVAAWSITTRKNTGSATDIAMISKYLNFWVLNLSAATLYLKAVLIRS